MKQNVVISYSHDCNLGLYCNTLKLVGGNSGGRREGSRAFGVARFVEPFRTAYRFLACRTRIE